MESRVTVKSISLSSITPGPWQPRRNFDSRSLNELASSIRRHGILTPLRVVQSNGDSFQIVAGERRWRAARIAGLNAAPCIVSRIESADILELAVVDNLHRLDLGGGEEAKAIARLSALGLTQENIAKRLGKSQAWVSQRIQISKLPSPILERLNAKEISLQEALALTKLLRFPDVLSECFEASGSLLRKRFGVYFPELGLVRIRSVLQAIDQEEKKSSWLIKMKQDGHEILHDVPPDGSKQFTLLAQGSDLARVHQAFGLTCEAWTWATGRPARFCTDRPTLLRLLNESRQALVAAHNFEGRQATLEQEGNRDHLLRNWLETTAELDADELAMLARHRIEAISTANQGAADRLARWLDKSDSPRALADILETATGGRLLQLWFSLELAHSMSYAIVPAWARSWLEDLASMTRKQLT